MHVLVTRFSSATESAQLQRALVKQFPNVSTIELALVLKTLDAILGKISFVVQIHGDVHGVDRDCWCWWARC